MACRLDGTKPLSETMLEFLLIGPLGTNFSNFFYRNSNIFIEENTFENVICKMSAILSQPQCVNMLNYLKDYKVIFSF